MSVEKNIREHFGWSQEQLAIYLGVSRSLIKLAEAGERFLPSTAGLKLAHLQLFILGKDAVGKALPKNSKTALSPKGDSKKLQRQVARYETLAAKTRQLLADMQQRYQQARNSIDLFEYLQPTVFATTGEEGKVDKIGLELIEAKAKLGLRRNGPDEQALLQWRIDCYQFATERARELTGKNS